MGGTFDPVHRGHVSIAMSFIDSPYIDELWIVLTPQPPHKPEANITGYRHRLNMLKLVFSDWENVRISEVERKLPEPSYTLQTLRHLHNTYRDRTFYLCIGSDSLVEFKTWHRWKEILEYCDLLVAGRPGEEPGELNNALRKKSHYISHEPVDISSTQIRNRLSEGKLVDEQVVPAGVLKYIAEHKLYS